MFNEDVTLAQAGNLMGRNVDLPIQNYAIFGSWMGSVGSVINVNMIIRHSVRVLKIRKNAMTKSAKKSISEGRGGVKKTFVLQTNEREKKGEKNG